MWYAKEVESFYCPFCNIQLSNGSQGEKICPKCGSKF